MDRPCAKPQSIITACAVFRLPLPEGFSSDRLKRNTEAVKTVASLTEGPLRTARTRNHGSRRNGAVRAVQAAGGNPPFVIAISTRRRYWRCSQGGHSGQAIRS